MKFDRLAYFARSLPVVRSAVERTLAEPTGGRRHAVAAAVRLIDDRAAAGREPPLSRQRPLRRHHACGSSTSSGREPWPSSTRARAARCARCSSTTTTSPTCSPSSRRGADDELFWFDDGGERRRATADDINRFVAEHAGPAFSAKDFRTWGGSAVALAARVQGAPVIDAVDEAAEELGNTRAVARSAYVHPRVLDASDDELAAVWRRSRRGRWLDRPESALAKAPGSVTTARPVERPATSAWYGPGPWSSRSPPTRRSCSIGVVDDDDRLRATHR